MLRDVRVHGAITEHIDFYATLAGERLLIAPFYEIHDGEEGTAVSLFLAGMYFKLDHRGVTFAGTGGAVSEYMFGSPMPLQDLGHKEVQNRLVLFGAFGGASGLTFTPQVSGFLSYDALFLDGNALTNSFFLIRVPWPYSVRRTQEVILKTLGRVLKRSEHPGSGDDSALQAEILRELAEPEATLLLLRLVHRPHQRFYQFLKGYYRRAGEWGDAEAGFAAKVAGEMGIEQYQRERIAVDILYKDERNRQVVDEYKDVLLSLMGGEPAPSATARLNSLRNLALRHGLPPTLFDTLDGLIPASPVLKAGEPDYLRDTREAFEGLFLSSRPPSEVLGPPEIVRLLRHKQAAQSMRDNGFEQILLDTGRMLDERLAQGGDVEALEVFSEVVTYFDRLDNAESAVNQLAFMENAALAEEKIRSVAGNRRALEEIQKGLFDELVITPVLENPYLLAAGRTKVAELVSGMDALDRGERTLADIVAQLDALARRESLERRMYEAIRSRLKQFYFDLSNPVHARLLQRDVEGELRKREEWEGAMPPEAFQSALDRVRFESEYLNNVVPKLLETGDSSLREDFVRQTGLDLYRLEELEREYRLAHGLEVPREGLVFPEE